MRRKLNLGFLAITLLMWAICVHTLLSSKSVQGLLSDLQYDIIPGAIAMTRIEYEAVEIRNWTFTYAMRGNVIRDGKTIKEWLHQQWAVLEKDAREHLERGHQVVEGERQTAQAIVDLSQKLVSASAEVIDLKDQGAGEDELLEKIRKEFGPVFYPLREVLNEHATAHLNELSAAETRVHDKHNTNTRYVITLGLGTTLLALLVALLVDRYFVQYITERKRAEVALRESEERYRALFEGSAEGILVADVETKEFKYANPTICRMLAYTTEELKGMSVADIHPKDALEHVVSEFEAQARGEKTLASNIPYLRKDGTTIYADISTTSLLIGGRECSVGFFSDITERKLAEEVLKREKERAEKYLDVAGVMLATLNADETITLINKRGCDILHYKEGELIGKNWFDTLVPEKIRDEIRGVFSKLMAGDIEPVEFYENPLLTKDGAERLIAFHNTVLRDPDGHTVEVLLSAEDITERKQAEQELKRLSAAVVESANMIVITDTEGIIEYVNPQFSRVTGYSLAEAVGKPASILKSGKQDKEFYEHLWQRITGCQTWSGILQNRRKNGDTYWERKTITPIFGEESHVTNYLSVGEDITNEIAAQQRVAEADKMSAIGMLAAGVAHEFKNCLAGIIGNASFALGELKEEGGVELAGETLSKIIELGEKANDVAMSLLTYSKTRPEDFNREDLRKIITRSISLVQKEMMNLSIETATYFEEVPEVEVSASKIQQLLLNLLINAQHAIKSNGVITIALLGESDHVKIKVGDTGVGIPQKNLNKIFDPFFSTKGVWGKDELVGTGMGLSICRNIAREHGGDLTVESIVGVGTTFTVTLPVGHHDEKVLKAAAEERQGFNVLIFTLDKSIVSRYFKQACEVNARIMLIDDITKLPDNLPQVADLVVCDAKFAGKVELYKMVGACRRFEVPYLIVNCGTMEYQLADLYEGSVANFKQLPDFSRIINSAVTPTPT